MGFPNVRRILKIGAPLSSYKLLLMAARFSRPKYSSLCLALLLPFVRDGEVSVCYQCCGRLIRAFIRMSDLQSDYMSVLELGVIDVYHLDHGFHPDLVIDGGGNIGMFTLRAAACLTPQGDSPIRFVVCEPVPTNIKQIRKNLEINRIEANILPVCLGGAHRTIPFYCREANQSSFDSSKPYTSQIEVPVIPLQDALGSNSAERILIKLDIEGMEVETLSAYIPQEKRAVYIVGELHNFSVNAPLMEELFQRNGWTLNIFGIADDLATFRACSPAALPLLKSMSEVQARSYVTAAI